MKALSRGILDLCYLTFKCFVSPMQIFPARQLLFFHPRYMSRLLRADARAIPEVPLKIVVMSDAAGSVFLRGPNISLALDRYRGICQLGEELAVWCADIVSMVSVREARLSSTCVPFERK